MLFNDRRHEQVAVERLARLLSEVPMTTTQAKHIPSDHCRAFIIALLLASVAGTWGTAFFLS
jgi:hypothetical protein